MSSPVCPDPSPISPKVSEVLTSDMACTVFGTVVTDQTVKHTSTKHMGKNITLLDMATMAFEMKNAEGKDVNAHKYLDEIRANHYCDGIKVLIYNATGGPVRLISYSVSDACVGPSPIPTVILNGQWGAYFHAIDAKDSGQKTGGHAIVYGGKNADGHNCQWMFVMEAKWPGRCFTEIRHRGHYPEGSWAYKNFATYSSRLSEELYFKIARDQGCYSFASMGGDSRSPFFEGVMTAEGVFPW